MNRILSVVPVLANEFWTKYCLNHIKNSDVLVIDNNAEKEVKKVIREHNKIVNTTNMYVNYAWNQGMEYFLQNEEYDFIAIINSDLRLVDNWESFCLHFFDDCFMFPYITKSKQMPEKIDLNNKHRKIKGGFPGIFIFMSREMVKMVYPIPNQLKLWYGDNWIFNKCGYEQRVYYNLKAEHGESRSASTLPNLVELVEKDRQEWAKILENGYLLSK
jgi:hypothetical protein